MHLIRDTTPRTDLIVYIYIYIWTFVLSDDFQKFSRIRCHLEQPVKNTKKSWMVIDYWHWWFLPMNWTSEEKCWTPKRCAVPSSNWSCDSCGMPHQGSIQGPSVNPDMNKLPLALESLQWQNLIFSAKTCYSCWLHDWRNTCARLKKKRYWTTKFVISKSRGLMILSQSHTLHISKWLAHMAMSQNPPFPLSMRDTRSEVWDMCPSPGKTGTSCCSQVPCLPDPRYVPDRHDLCEGSQVIVDRIQAGLSHIYSDTIHTKRPTCG